MTSGTGQPEQDSQIRTAGTGQQNRIPKKGRQKKTGRTRFAE
jgi:hypothetical protein